MLIYDNSFAAMMILPPPLLPLFYYAFCFLMPLFSPILMPIRWRFDTLLLDKLYAAAATPLMITLF